MLSAHSTILEPETNDTGIDQNNIESRFGVHDVVIGGNPQEDQDIDSDNESVSSLTGKIVIVNKECQKTDTGLGRTPSRSLTNDDDVTWNFNALNNIETSDDDDSYDPLFMSPILLLSWF